MTQLAAAVLAGLCAGSTTWVAASGLRARRDRRPAPLRALAAIGRAAPRAIAVAGRRDLSVAIDRAGLGGVLAPSDLAAARLVCASIAVALLPRLAASLPLRTMPIAAALIIWAAAEAPLWWLRRRAQRRQSQLREALPDALDLLGACLAAGLPLRRSLGLVARHCAEPVAGEFAAVSAETALGVPQAQAMASLAARNPQPEMRALVSAFDQANRHGSPLAPAVAALAQDARHELNRTIVERGARAGPKIQLVVSATIVPAALLGMGAVVIAAIARGEITFV